MGLLIPREEAIIAVKAVIHAGITDLWLGRGENIGADHTDNDGRVLEWVTIGTVLWERYAPGIRGPWEHSHEETDEMLWAVIDEVDLEMLPIDGPIRKHEGDGYAEDICLERVLPTPENLISLYPLYADRLKAAAVEMGHRMALAKYAPTYDREQLPCCARVRPEYRYVHASSSDHIAALFAVEPGDLRAEMRYAESRAASARTMAEGA